MLSNSNEPRLRPKALRYRSAIALNSVGCRLLERGCYVQAVDSFEQACRLIKSVSDMTRYDCETYDDCGASHVARCLQHLHDSRHSSNSPATVMATLTVTTGGFLIDAEIPTTNDTLLEFFHKQGPCSPVLFPVQIDVYDRIDDDAEESETMLVQHLAIMSHNLGLACFCTARTADPSLHENSILKLTEGALYLTQVSSCAFVQQVTVLRNKHRLNILAFDLRCLSIAILNSLIHVLHICNQPERCQDVCKVLTQLETDAVEQEKSTPYLVCRKQHKHDMNYAAAAA